MIDKIIKDIKDLFKVQDKKCFVLENIPYLAFFYVGNIFSHHIRSYVGGDIIDKIFQGLLEINTLSLIPSLHLVDIAVGISISALVKSIIYFKGKNAKKFRQGKEYGSARWGNAKDIENNIEAILMLNHIEKGERKLDVSAQEVLAKYVGWGGLADVFDESKGGQWLEARNILKENLSPLEYEAAKESTLTAFYTPKTVIDSVYKTLSDMGFKKGNILEPSMGIGNFIGNY